MGNNWSLLTQIKPSQTCSNCGYDEGKHDLDVRQLQCHQCKKTHDRDVNTAINIKQLILNQVLVK